MLPKDYDPAKKYPLVVSVHGGPSWACMSKWPTGGMGDMTAASLLGWFVLVSESARQLWTRRSLHARQRERFRRRRLSRHPSRQLTR